MQTSALFASEKEFASHAAHARSAIEVPFTATCSPATHVVHVEQLAALKSLAKVPPAHAVHSRWLVAEPSFEM